MSAMFDALIILMFLMFAVLILGSLAMVVDTYLDPDPDATRYDREQQESQTKGVKL